MNIKKIILSCLLILSLCSVLTAQILMPDEEILKKEIMNATGKNTLSRNWDSFFKQRNTFFQSENFNKINEIKSSNYYFIENFGGDANLEYSFVLIDEDNSCLYKYEYGKFRSSKIPNSYKTKISKLNEFHNLYVQGMAVRNTLVNLSVSVKNNNLNWFLTEGSINSDYFLGTKAQKKEIQIYESITKILDELNTSNNKKNKIQK